MDVSAATMMFQAVLSTIGILGSVVFVVAIYYAWTRRAPAGSPQLLQSFLPAQAPNAHEEEVRVHKDQTYQWKFINETDEDMLICVVEDPKVLIQSEIHIQADAGVARASLELGQRLGENPFQKVKVSRFAGSPGYQTPAEFVITKSHKVYLRGGPCEFSVVCKRQMWYELVFENFPICHSHNDTVIIHKDMKGLKVNKLVTGVQPQDPECEKEEGLGVPNSFWWLPGTKPNNNEYAVMPIETMLKNVFSPAKHHDGSVYSIVFLPHPFQRAQPVPEPWEHWGKSPMEIVDYLCAYLQRYLDECTRGTGSEVVAEVAEGFVDARIELKRKAEKGKAKADTAGRKIPAIQFEIPRGVGVGVAGLRIVEVERKNAPFHWDSGVIRDVRYDLQGISEKDRFRFSPPSFGQREFAVLLTGSVHRTCEDEFTVLRCKAKEAFEGFACFEGPAISPDDPTGLLQAACKVGDILVKAARDTLVDRHYPFIFRNFSGAELRFAVSEDKEALKAKHMKLGVAGAEFAKGDLLFEQRSPGALVTVIVTLPPAKDGRPSEKVIAMESERIFVRGGPQYWCFWDRHECYELVFADRMFDYNLLTAKNMSIDIFDRDLRKPVNPFFRDVYPGGKSLNMTVAKKGA